MQPWMSDVHSSIVKVKAELRRRIPDLKERFAAVSAWAEREVAAVAEERQRGNVVPELRYEELADGGVPEGVADRIRRRGCAIVRGVFSQAQAAAWNEGIGSCPNGITNADACRTALGAGEEEQVATLVSFGFPAHPRDPGRRSPEEWIARADRRPFDEVVEFR